MINLYHLGDPNRKTHHWPFVYLHGWAEEKNALLQDLKHWDDIAADCVSADQPLPTVEGDYPGMLYGMEVTIFLRKRFGWTNLCGRVACPEDKVGYAHASKPEDWR